MLLERVGDKVIDGVGAFAIELQEETVLKELESLVEVVDGIGVSGGVGTVEEVVAEGKVRFVVVQVAKHGRHHVVL